MNYTDLQKPFVDLGLQAKVLADLTRELSLCCQGKEEQIYGRFGLPVSAGRVLLAVAESSGSSPSVLADKLGLGRSRLTPLVELLVTKGLLMREESEDDRRVRDLTLTAQGRKIAHEVHAYQLAFHQELLEQFSEPERGEILACLQHLRYHMEDVRNKMK